jgi:hypothetical protein
LNSAALPSITGSAAAGPMLPSPNTAEPSVTMATVFRLIVSRATSDGFSTIALHTRATPGVYARDRSSRCLSDTVGLTSSLPPRWMRNVRSLTLRTFTPGNSPIALVIASECCTSIASHVTSATRRPPCDSTTSNAVRVPPALAITAVSPDVALADGSSTRTVME